MEKNLETSPSPPKSLKVSRELLSLLVSINMPSLVTSRVLVQITYLKMYLVSCADTHRGVTHSLYHGIVKNTKTLISGERNIIFLWNEKFFNLCFRWHILRTCRFVAKVTFKDTKKKTSISFLYQQSSSYCEIKNNHLSGSDLFK